MAGEAGVPFFTASGSEFIEVFVGVGASRVRKLFEQAKAKAPAIVFIDELDAIGKSRSNGGNSGGSDERDQTLNQLLVEMDGFDSRDGIVVLAATNRAEILDSALLRPGRFDRQVLVDRPDGVGRHAILRVHARKVKLAEDVDLEYVAKRTPGFVGADLENVLNEAALLAARSEKISVGMPELHAAIDRVVVGLERKNRLTNVKERRIVAFHESGHAIVAELAGSAEPVHKVPLSPGAWQRLVTCSRRQRTETCCRKMSSWIAWRCCWADGRPNNSRLENFPPARRTISSAPQDWRGA